MSCGAFTAKTGNCSSDGIGTRPRLRVVCKGGVLCAVLVITGTAAWLTAGGMLEIADLLSHPDQYDKQMVVVVGKVTNLQIATNRQGHMGYGFLLNDANGSVKVVGLGRAEVHDGEQVIVEGVFSRLRQAGRLMIYNEIKANSIWTLDRMNPDLVG